MNYLGKFSLATAEVCEPLRKITSKKSEWMWNSPKQHLYNRAKIIIKKNATMPFYDEEEQLYQKQMCQVWVSEQVFCKQGMECGFQETNYPTMWHSGQ